MQIALYTKLMNARKYAAVQAGFLSGRILGVGIAWVRLPSRSIALPYRPVRLPTRSA